MAKGKKAFGGYAINFKGCHDTMTAVFGDKPIGPSEMTKKLWAYVKRKKLGPGHGGSPPSGPPFFSYTVFAMRARLYSREN